MKRIIFFITFWILVCFSVVGQISKDVTTKHSDLIIEKIGEYDKIFLDNEFYTTDIVGEPELPVYIQSFVIPRDAHVNGIIVNNVNKQKLTGNYYIYPVQPPLPVSFKDSIKDFSLSDPTVYNSSVAYPGKQAEIISDDIYLGYRIVTVRLYPIEYNPQAKELYSCNFNFTIDYSTNAKQAENDEFVTQSQSLHRYELNKKNIKLFVKNPDAVDDYDTKVQKVIQGKTVVYDFSAASNKNESLRSQAVSVVNEQVPEYIIITNNALKASFQDLADWKTKKGIFTIIVTTEEINANYSGNDLQEKIRSYLLNASNKWGNGLYVLLGGDINIVPARFTKAAKSSDKSSYPSDKYYSTLGGWRIYNGNVFEGSNSISIINILGRIPVSNTQEVAIYTNKIKTYESANGLGDLNYLKNNLYADAYLEHYPDEGLLANFYHLWIKDHVSSYVPENINEKFICDNADCSGNTSWYDAFRSTCDDENINGDLELNRDNFLSCLNTGANLIPGKFHFIYHLDHSGAYNMGTSDKDKGQKIKRSDMDNLTNGTSWQILMSGGCHPANFAYDCIAKHFLTNPNGGGVAFIGNPDVGWQNDDDIGQIKNFSDAIYNTEGRYDIGSAFQNALINTLYQGWRLHLLGEPEMQVWTDIPQVFNDSIISPTNNVTTTGQQNINISIDGLTDTDTARICIWKDTEVYETRNVVNGVHSFEVTPETAGTMYVTITAHNFFPKEDSITVNASTGPNLFVESIEFIDNGVSNSSIGNGNGRNDAGETICLQAVIRNNGMSQANNVVANLACNTNSIDILSQLIGSPPTDQIIPSRDSIVVEFLYQIDKDMSERLINSTNPVTFELEITATEGVWTKTFNIDIFASNLIPRNKIITNSASSPFGMQIELQNIGKAPSTELTGYLLYNNNNDSIAVTFPAIDYWETQLSDTLQIPLAFDPDLNFTLKVKNAYEKEWTFDDFNLNKPYSVPGLKFFSKEKAIDLFWNRAADGYNIYRCDVDANDNESGDYVRLNNTPVTFRNYDLYATPLHYNDANNLTGLTKYFYKVTGVSSTGMESEPVRLLAWTSYPPTGLFPVIMDDLDGTRMESHFVAEDVNNDGKKEIFTALAGSDSEGVGDLIALDWEGKELFDIDNDSTTYSGFANLNTAIRAGVAIADINNDGIKEIISVTRGFENNLMNNKITCHTAFDDDLDNKPDTLWQTPVQLTARSAVALANLDNSPDGSMEIVVFPCGNSPSPAPQIYDAQGGFIRELPVTSGHSTYAAGAVADLDGDGNMEIIAGYNGGLYVWNHDGSSFGSDSLFFTLPGYSFASSPVICNMNGTGEKEILISAFLSSNNGLSCRILAIDTSGNMLPGWDTNPNSENVYTSTDNDPYSRGLSKEIAVGDLDGDETLEVVAVGAGCIKIWNKNGVLCYTINVPDVESQTRSPLLADIDGDSEIEIIVTSNTATMPGKIYAYKRNGDGVLGFPLETDMGLTATPVIADLDGNGKSEIIAGTGDDKKIYVWETDGDPNRIEWGSARNNARNTGEYEEKCWKTIIQSNTVWNSNREVCGDIIVKSGTLTLNPGCTLTMKGSSTIILYGGANLVISGGSILDANIEASSASSVTLQNNGYVKLRPNGEFNILQGAIFYHYEGKIDITR